MFTYIIKDALFKWLILRSNTARTTGVNLRVSTDIVNYTWMLRHLGPLGGFYFLVVRSDLVIF